MMQLEILGVSHEVIRESIENLRNNFLDDAQKQEVLVSIKHRHLRVMNPLGFLVEEVCDCLLTNKNTAAVTTTNLLLESTLKLALIIKESNGRTLDDGVAFEDMYREEVEDNIEIVLNKSINKALNEGLIDEGEQQELLHLKNKYRNPFSHSSHNDEIKNATNTIYIGSIDNPTEICERRVLVRNQPHLYYPAMHEFMNREAYGYFTEVYCYIDIFDKRLSELYKQFERI